MIKKREREKHTYWQIARHTPELLVALQPSIANLRCWWNWTHISHAHLEEVMEKQIVYMHTLRDLPASEW